jgi:hypothetical protein
LSLAHINDENPAIFGDFLPLLILCCMNEMSNEELKTYIYDEIVAVFSSVGLRVDIRDSCQFIFTFFAGVEKHFTSVGGGDSVRDQLSENVIFINFIQIILIVFQKKVNRLFFKLKEHVMSAKTKVTDKFPASVLSAIACSNYYSALEILEKHVIKKDRAGTTIFERELFSLLEVSNN